MGDAEFLERLFERALFAVEEGLEVTVDDLLEGRVHLRAVAEDWIRRARRVAVTPRDDESIAVPGYDVLRLLGHGGMGAVYLARQRRVGGREVALKILPAGLALSRAARERFRAEANLVAKIRHPNVIGVYDVVDEPAVHAYAMERVEGPSLAELIGRVAASRGERPALDVVRESFDAGAIPDRTYATFVCRIGEAIARALGAVHRAGLLHRDVKPSNVLLRRDGTPLLSDFGLVRDTDSGNATHTGRFAGTPAYAAPEQLRGPSSSLDARADVYALGVTLYHALALELPFRGRSTAELLGEIEAGRAVPLRRRDPSLAADVETVVGKAMDADRDRRYATADDLADDLERLLSLQPILAKPAGLASRVAKLVRRNRKAVAAAAAGTLAGVLLAAAFAAWWLALPRWAAARVREARLALLDPVQGTGIFASETWRWSFSGAPPTVGAGAMDDALAAYSAALRFAGDDPDLRLERDTVARARDLAASGVGFDATSPSDPASARDLRSSGLLAFLLGRVDGAIDSWSRLELVADPDPFVDAALGQVYLVRGEAARAYPRLLRAVEAFPGVGFLAVGLADAALRSGDVPKARRQLEAAKGMARLDPFRGLERVEGDLLAALGDVEGALALYAIAEPVNPFAKLRHVELLEREGRLREALEIYASVPASGEWEAWDRALIDAAESWWDALPHHERFAAVRESIDDGDPAPQGRRRTPLGALRETLARRQAKRRAEFAAVSPVVPAPFASGGPLRTLTERMEATTMASWTRWRTYPAFFRNLVAAAWLSPEPAAATAAVDRVCRGWRWSAALVVGALVAAPDASAQGTFQGLGDLPGGAFASYGYEISADGTTIVGAGTSDVGQETFRWRAETGMVNVGHLPGPIIASVPGNLSADGEVVIGWSYSNNSTSSSEPREAFVWTEATGIQPLGFLPGGRLLSEAFAVSADGTRIFGGSIGPDEKHHAVEWSLAGDVTDLMVFPGNSQIFGCTGDATTLVGSMNHFNGMRRSSGIVQNLGELPGGENFCWMYSVTEDGNFVVGESASMSGREAVYWTEATGLVGLGDFVDGGFGSAAIDVATDGSLIVGYGTTGLGREAAVWDSNLVMIRAADFLAARGVEIPVGWTLDYVYSVWIGCSTIAMVGTGINPAGDSEAWYATYPNATALALRAGNVDTGAGGPAVDVMFVNGSAGDPAERRVTVTAGVPATLHVDKAPETGGPKGGYGFWIYDGELRGCEAIQFKKPSGELFTLGQANGCMPINNTLAPGTCPCPMSFPLGKTSRRLSPAKATLLCLEASNSLRSPTDHSIVFPEGTFTILSLHQDRNSPSSPGKNIAIGNTIVVVSEP